MEKVDVLEDKKSIDPLGVLNRDDMMGFLTRSLTQKERFIIEQYYQVGHTMREIGDRIIATIDSPSYDCFDKPPRLGSPTVN